MIKSKGQFINAVRANKEAFLIKTIKHHTNWQVGIERKITIATSTGIALESTKPNGETFNSWVYFDDVTITNCFIVFKDCPIIMEIIEVESQKA